MDPPRQSRTTPLHLVRNRNQAVGSWVPADNCQFVSPGFVLALTDSATRTSSVKASARRTRGTHIPHRVGHTNQDVPGERQARVKSW